MTRRERILEDLTWLVGTDTPDRIATRLGYATPNNLATMLRRWGYPDLANQLTGRKTP